MNTQKSPFFPPGVEWLIEALMRFSDGGVLDIAETGELRIAGTKVTPTAAELNVLAGMTASTAELNKMDGVTKTAAQINALVEGAAGGYKLARGQQTTVAASDTVVTGLATVVAAIAVLDSDPVDDPFMVSCSIGDQAGAPAAGSILIKTWKNTGGTDPSPLAATTFGKKVNWIAIGT